MTATSGSQGSPPPRSLHRRHSQQDILRAVRAKPAPAALAIVKSSTFPHPPRDRCLFTGVRTAAPLFHSSRQTEHDETEEQPAHPGGGLASLAGVRNAAEQKHEGPDDRQASAPGEHERQAFRLSAVGSDDENGRDDRHGKDGDRDRQRQHVSERVAHDLRTLVRPDSRVVERPSARAPAASNTPIRRRTGQVSRPARRRKAGKSPALAELLK